MVAGADGTAHGAGLSQHAPDGLRLDGSGNDDIARRVVGRRIVRMAGEAHRKATRQGLQLPPLGVPVTVRIHEYGDEFRVREQLHRLDEHGVALEPGQPSRQQHDPNAQRWATIDLLNMRRDEVRDGSP